MAAPLARSRIDALDGLRGVALLAILAFHANAQWLPGAALSVTVFFVLSGFLITSLLLAEREATGRIDLRRFWTRRVRRLVPASIATVVFIALLVATGALPGGRDVIGDAVAAMTWTANWRFVVTGSTYAALFRAPSPFEHFWSLAVEEQVYLLVPLAAVLLLGRNGAHRLRFGLVVAAGIAASTFAACTLQAAGTGGHAYYGTDARMAEPLVGVLLAVLVSRRDGIVQVRRTWLVLTDVAGGLALAGLAVLLVTLSVGDPRLYRGGFLLGAVLAAIVVFAATQPTVLASALAARPLAALGTISYAAYLFHWPVFRWIDPQQHATVAALATELTVTLLLAVASTKLLEEPIRLRRRISMPIFVTGWVNAAVLAIAVTVVAIPAPPRVVAASASHAVLDDWVRGTPEPPPSTHAGQLRVAVVGDSLAHNVAVGLQDWAATRHDVVVYDVSISFCPLSRGGERRWAPNYDFGLNPACSWWADSSSPRAVDLRAFAPDIVVALAPYSELLDRRWSVWQEPADASYRTALAGEYARLLATLRTRVITLNAPCADFSQPKGWNLVTHPAQRVAEMNADVYARLEGSVHGDLDAQLCPHGRYTPDLWGIRDARFDGMHLSEPAATSLARRWLGPLVVRTAR